MSKSTMKSKISPGGSSSTMAMSNFKSSVNYLWNTNSVLGKGATGAVYYGHNKHTGETVAVKCFNHLSHMRPYEVQKREFEVLKKVNHENIVKLLAIEEENDTKQKVLVMELCTGGSLFNILDDPLNGNGLEEKEFLLVLKHLAAGMKHLRDMNIIHRDLKPGNIMKFISEDGTSIYKLTDFGAARELDDDQQFMSLYGTEEYLHPDMYERAVLRKPVGKSFKANVDLWSIGVTLYHIATGSLPFRPYGGRKNKETMYKITTEKASGIISGTQTSENGEIKWSRTLPESCLLSASVQPLVTELLAGLLECDAHRMWSFEKFFSSVTHILEHKVVYVFYVGTLSFYAIYCHISETVGDLKSKFQSMFQIHTNDQILIYTNDELNIHIGATRHQRQSEVNVDSEPSLINQFNVGKSRSSSNNILLSPGVLILPDEYNICDVVTTDTVPLYLVSGQMNSKIRSAFGPVVTSKFPEICTAANADADSQCGKQCSSLAYTSLRQIDKFVHNYKLACSIPCHMLKLIDKNIKLLDEKQSSILFQFSLLKEKFDNVIDTNGQLSQLLKSLTNVTTSTSTRAHAPPVQLMHTKFSSLPNIDQLKSTYDNINEQLKNLTSTNIIDQKLAQLRDLWCCSKESDNTKLLISAQQKAKVYAAKIRECWLLLYKDKQIKSLNIHEEQLHQLEKMKLENYCRKLNDLISKEINPCLSIADKLEEWYQGAQVAYVKPQLIISGLNDFLPVITELEAGLQKAKEEQCKLLTVLCKEIKELHNTSVTVSQQQTQPFTQSPITQPVPTFSLEHSNNSSPLNTNGGTISMAMLLKEIESLRETSRILKDAFREHELIIAEVDSFTDIG